MTAGRPTRTRNDRGYNRISRRKTGQFMVALAVSGKMN
jgi:hypothetical protein